MENSFNFSLTEHCIYHNGPRNGTIFLFDMKGARVSHALQPSISSLRKVIRLIENGCPFRIRAVHVLNTVPFLDLFLGSSL